MAQPTAQKKLLARFLILALMFGVLWFVRYRQQVWPTSASSSPNTTQQVKRSQAGVPEYVLEVLDYIRQNGAAPDGYVGGREFQNREKRLPAKSIDGSRIRYSEWDVHRKIPGKNRGAERLVTGSDHSAWYTKDHYKSFQKID